MPENNEKITDNTEGKKRHVLRTLKADTSDYVKTKKLSLVDLAAMKERAKEKQDFIPPTGSPIPFYKNRVFIAAVLFAAALGAGYYFFFKSGSQPQPTSPLNPPLAILSSQQEKILDINNPADLGNQLKTVLKETYNPGDLIYLPIKLGKTENTPYMNSASFLKFIGADTPPQLIGFIENNFFLGVLNTDKKHPVIIFVIKKGKYETAYAGMLQWENTMLKDISFFFQPEDTEKTSTNFKDGLVENRSVRIAITDSDGILLYTILNKSYIVITDSAAGLKELINRFEIYKFS